MPDVYAIFEKAKKQIEDKLKQEAKVVSEEVKALEVAAKTEIEKAHAAMVAAEQSRLFSDIPVNDIYWEVREAYYRLVNKKDS